MLGLALSGGGFRATLFHLGSLLRINEAGLLGKLDEITSVSGGSIIAGHLGLRWRQLEFDEHGVATNFDTEVTVPIREFCSRTIDVGVILGGIMNPVRHPSHLLRSRYRKHLYGDGTLQDLPAPGEGPRFTIYATSLQTGASVRFTREFLGEYHLGRIPNPNILIAAAVAASSAFPPPLCPLKLKVDPESWIPDDISDLHGDPYLMRTMWLADGGVYDNLGLERLVSVCDRILVSDAGAPFAIKKRLRAVRYSQIARTRRAISIMSEQVRARRSQRLIQQFVDGEKSGAYWSIGTCIEAYPLLEQGLTCSLVNDSDDTAEIAEMRTRLNRFADDEQRRLINWGYALSDAALRSRFDISIAESNGLPYPGERSLSRDFS